MEIKFGFGVGRKLEPFSLKKLGIETIANNLSSLREVRRKLKAIHREVFKKNYGNLLGLLKLEVQIPALATIAQHYDSSLRCFTF